jgi:hypothetical protein
VIHPTPPPTPNPVGVNYAPASEQVLSLPIEAFPGGIVIQCKDGFSQAMAYPTGKTKVINVVVQCLKDKKAYRILVR